MPKVEGDIKLDFQDVLIKPKRSQLKSRAEVVLDWELTFKHTKKTWTGVPVVASNMDTIGTFDMASALSKHGLLTILNKYCTVDEWDQFAQSHADALKYTSASAGCLEKDFETLRSVLNKVPEISIITLDVANGYQQSFHDYVRRVREAFPDHIIIAGNVVTPEAVDDLIRTGADVVKIGIGPGSVCTTRLKTGVGYPQLSAILECSEAAHDAGGRLMADGGCTCPGDVAKAFGAGADMVMVGGMLAGHDQSGGELCVKSDGSKVKIFYGMASDTAMSKHSADSASYRTSEGKTVEVSYKGDINTTLLDLLGGLRSTCTYTGSRRLQDLSSKTTFIRVRHQLNYFYGK